MRKLLTIVFCWLICGAALAQDAEPRVEPPNRATEKIPQVVSFTQAFPDFTPPFYSISIEPTGRAEYKSTPKPDQEGDPYVVKFTASEPVRTRVFELARQLHYFRDNFEYTKSKVAFTGTKTLYFKNAKEEHQTSYNWSDNPQVQELTTLFQNIEETSELGRKLEEKYRFDKLGVDAILKTLEQEAKDNRLAELQAIQPILSRVAKDPNLMNISRRRAEFLLTKLPKPELATTVGEQ